MDDEPSEGTQAIPATPAWVLADRYRVLDRLGSGGMADVFRAHDDQLDRDVAVKVFRTPVDEPGNATAVARREIELRALAQLSHPNLIALYDANIAGAQPAFLVTELVIGPNLADRLNDGPLPETMARTVGEQIADALAYVHARGMVHRDVKPANILLGTDGATPETAAIRARLSDFGIVRMLEDAHLTAAEFTLGTAFYIAPEQARGGDVDAAADVYSLGLVLIEMLTGKRSFDGPMHEAMAARLTRAPEIPEGLPQPWPGLLTAMTRIDPVLRPTADEVAQSLRTSTIATLAVAAAPPLPLAGVPAAVAGTASPSGAAAGAPVPFELHDPLPPRRRRPGLGLAVGALAALAVIAAAVILMLPSSHPTAPAGGASNAPTAGPSHPPATRSTKSSDDAAIPVTAGGSTGSSSAATSAAPSTSRAPSTHSSSTPHHSSTPAKPSSSTAEPTPSKTKTTSPPASSPATTSTSSTSTSASASGGAASSAAA